MFMNYHYDDTKDLKEYERLKKRIKELDLPDWSLGYDNYRRLLKENERANG